MESAAQPDLKSKMKSAWMAGDFGQVARYTAGEGEEFVARLGIETGERLLDVACGTGNLAIPAARRGAVVTGVDIATNLLQQARERASAEGLNATFDEGDAEELPYPDGAFDFVVSMFGAMFAPRPERTAAELLRVCRPGGRIAMANWTPEGFPGQMFKISAKHVPPPDVPPPVLWGKEDVVRERFGAGVTDLRCTRRFVQFDYPFPPAETVEFFRRYFGPTQVAFNRLDAAGQDALRRDLVEHWTKNNEGGAERTFVKAEYLEVVAVRK